MNYGRVNNIVAYSEDLSLEAKGLYAIVCSLCGSKDYCYASLNTFSKLSQKSKSTVQRLFKELQTKGVVQRNYNPSLCKTVTLNLMDTKTLKSKF